MLIGHLASRLQLCGALGQSGQCWMGLDGGQRWVLPPAASWAEEAEVDAAAAHCFLEGRFKVKVDAIVRCYCCLFKSARADDATDHRCQATM